MCLIIFSYKTHPDYDLIVAENHDEFYDRILFPISLTPFNDDKQYGILKGFDLKSNGTWFGISKEKKFSAITNFRDPLFNLDNKKSRGHLVKNFLNNKMNSFEYAKEIHLSRKEYKGYNILLYDNNEFYFYSNKEEEIKKINPGIYGLSNHLLDTPWPKVEKGKNIMKKTIFNNQTEIENSLFDFLYDYSFPLVSDLPNTGVGKKWEIILSSVFVKSEIYGTRSSIVMFVKENIITISERVFNRFGNIYFESKIKYNLKEKE